MSYLQPQRRSPLHSAAAHAHPDATMITVLLHHGAQPNQVDANGNPVEEFWTPDKGLGREWGV